METADSLWQRDPAAAAATPEEEELGERQLRLIIAAALAAASREASDHREPQARGWLAVLAVGQQPMIGGGGGGGGWHGDRQGGTACPAGDHRGQGAPAPDIWIVHLDGAADAPSTHTTHLSHVRADGWLPQRSATAGGGAGRGGVGGERGARST
jgi:hypothetical protein